MQWSARPTIWTCTEVTRTFIRQLPTVTMIGNDDVDDDDNNDDGEDDYDDDKVAEDVVLDEAVSW